LFWYDSAIARAVLAAAGVPDDGTPRNGLDLIGTYYSPSFRDGIRDDEITGMLTLQYYPTGDVMLYGGYHHGYKAGGVNLFREGVITDTTYRPETADSLEVGIKADYWNGRARTNVALFDTEFKDLQINFFTGLEFRTENTGEATTRGLEIENFFQITSRLRVDLAATYLDATFGDLDSPSLTYLDHRDTPRAPAWSAVTSLSYERPLANGSALFFRGLVSYTGEHYTGADVLVEQKSESYVVTDLDVGLRRDDRRWEAVLWCRNCGDQRYRTIYFNTTFQPGSYSAYLGAPREYGVTLRTLF
jgi:outer membrane receptor protein involved in Fe transport